MIVISPSDGMSTKMLIRQAAALNGPVFVRLGRAAVPGIYEEESKIEIGKGMCVREGGDYTVIATGVMVNEALIAAEMLEKEGISLRVIIIKAAKETKGIVTAEEHSIYGGLGSAVSEVVVRKCPIKMAFVGLADTFGESGKPAELLTKYGLTADAIAAAVKNL
jgi:transketolase